MNDDLVAVLLGPPYSDDLAAIMDDIEQERRADLARQHGSEPWSAAGRETGVSR